MDDDITTDINKPNRLTVTLVIRWIFGLLFLLCFVVALSQGNIIASLMVLLAAIFSLPPASKILESRINLSLSGALRFILVFVLVIGFGAALPPTTHETSSVQNAAAVPSLILYSCLIFM